VTPSFVVMALIFISPIKFPRSVPDINNVMANVRRQGTNGRCKRATDGAESLLEVATWKRSSVAATGSPPRN
jgi:hypothetical protein